MSIESISLLNTFTPFPDTPETASAAARREHGPSSLVTGLNRQEDEVSISEQGLLLARKQEQETSTLGLARQEEPPIEEPGAESNLPLIQNEEKDEDETSLIDEDEEEELEEGELTEEERDQIEQLKDRDLEVRTHEQAHLRAAGNLALGGPTYEYQRGPDGRNYAVGGHVDINVSEVPNDPQATILRAEQVRRAALAPAEPSGKDRQVAAQAQQLAARARAEIRQEGLEETEIEPGNVSSEDEQNEAIGPTRSSTDNDPAEVDFTTGFKSQPEESPFTSTGIGYNLVGQSSQPVSSGFSLIA